MVLPCPVCGKKCDIGKTLPPYGSERHRDICIALDVPQDTFDRIQTRRFMCFSHFDDEEFYYGKRRLKPSALPRELTPQEKEFLFKSNFNQSRFRRTKEEMEKLLAEERDDVPAIASSSAMIQKWKNEDIPTASSSTTTNLLTNDVNGIFRNIKPKKQQVKDRPSFKAKKEMLLESPSFSSSHPYAKIKILRPPVNNQPNRPSTSQASNNDSGTLKSSNNIQQVKPRLFIIKKQQQILQPKDIKPSTFKPGMKVLVPSTYKIQSKSEANDDEKVGTSSVTNMLLERCLQYSQFNPVEDDQSNEYVQPVDSTYNEEAESMTKDPMTILKDMVKLEKT